MVLIFTHSLYGPFLSNQFYTVSHFPNLAHFSPEDGRISFPETLVPKVCTLHTVTDISTVFTCLLDVLSVPVITVCTVCPYHHSMYCLFLSSQYVLSVPVSRLVATTTQVYYSARVTYAHRCSCFGTQCASTPAQFTVSVCHAL